MRCIPIVVLTSLVLSCGGESTTDPPEEQAGPAFQIQPNVTYIVRDGVDLRLDLYLPTGVTGPFPALVFIYGGGWANGNRQQLAPQARYLAPKGFVGAVIDHRFAPAHVFPAALHDVKAAVRWLRANASTYNIDPSRIGIAGASSGGHLAALVGTTHGIPAFEGEGNPGFSSSVQAVAAFNPPLDLVALNSSPLDWIVEVVESLMGAPYADDPDSWVNASPITHVSPSSAPMLLLHGTLDEEIPHQQSVQMKTALTEAGVQAELFSAEGASHGFFNSEPWATQTKAALEDFFVRMLK